MTDAAKPDPTEAPTVPDSPPARPLPVPLGHSQRVAMFGSFAFTPAPLPGNPEHVVIAAPWVHDHTVSVPIPQLGTAARVNKLIARQFLALWGAWERAGLLDRVLTFDGAHASRYKRGRAGGGPEALSNHCWGTAFDINAQWNPYGHTPAPLGHHGCVRELEPLANEHGFAWGGRFHSHPDGMHLEAYRVVS